VGAKCILKLLLPSTMLPISITALTLSVAAAAFAQTPAEKVREQAYAGSYGGLLTDGARRTVSRQVPQQLRKPEAFQPNQQAHIEFLMPDICHTFRPGHRIVVQTKAPGFP